MKIKSIRLRDFKRFTDLTISELPETAKLVVLIGPNGCGKSSVFDALHGKSVVRYYWGWNSSPGYWNKKYSLDNKEESSEFNDNEKIIIDFHQMSPTDPQSWAKSIYTRSAYRNDPVIQIQQLSQVGAAVDERRFARMIENDATINKNYQRLVSDGLEDAFEESDDKVTLGDFRKQLIGDIKEVICQLFDDPPLDLNSLGSPLRDGTFRFTKGEAKKFLYENISGGEKAAFDLVLDLVIKRREFNDTVFCIDEPEAHLGLRLQGRLLRELYRLIPDNCQLWIATHSIGMIRAAYDLEQGNPRTVTFLDFYNKNFDQPEIIKPSKINRKIWENIHRVVMEDLAALVAPNKVILCEGKPGDEGLDAQCYNTVFAEKYLDTLFVSTGGKGQGANYGAVVKAIVNVEITLLRDKDNLSEREIEQEKSSGKRVLSRIKIEDYLLDDEVLIALCKKYAYGDGSKVNDLLRIEQEKLQEKNNNTKAIVNDLRMWTINSLGVQNAGDNSSSFLQDTLAPLIEPSMEVYKELEKDIFGDDGSCNSD